MRNPEKLIIPLLENDSLKDIIYIFLQVLHEENYIYLSNDTESNSYASQIFQILKKIMIHTPQEIAEKILERLEPKLGIKNESLF